MGLTTFDYYLAVNRSELTNYKKCMHRHYIKFAKNQKIQYILIQLCHKIVIYDVNLVYIAYIHNLIAIVLQWAFTIIGYQKSMEIWVGRNNQSFVMVTIRLLFSKINNITNYGPRSCLPCYNLIHPPSPHTHTERAHPYPLI